MCRGRIDEPRSFACWRTGAAGHAQDARAARAVIPLKDQRLRVDPQHVRGPKGALTAAVLMTLAFSATAGGHATRPFGTLPPVPKLSAPIAPDPLAPSGAGPTWLPQVPWVMERWLPFNEVDLYTALGLDWRHYPPDQAYMFFYLNTGKNLDDLARSFGLNTKTLPTKLLRERQSYYRPGLYKILLRRTKFVLTQPHLAQHVLFHWFHDWSMETNTLPLFGVTPSTLYKLRHVDGESLRAIAAQHGISFRELRRRMLAREWTTAERGVTVNALSKTEARQRQWDLRWAVRGQIDAGSMPSM
jgi:lambda repressor-like predicted transcriptional regulator